MAPPVATKPKPKRKRAPIGLSQEEASQRVGCNQSTISRAIRRGAIETYTNGRIPESQVAKLIELRKEDEQASEEMTALTRRTTIAETLAAEAKAELQQLKLKLESGKYIELAIVKRDGEATGERIQSVLRSVPQRCALGLECACRTAAEVEAVICDEVERAIAELRESEYIHAADAV